MVTGREHDIVLFGATGFTGRLTADYLARHAPPECRWALAGRNKAKLETLRDELGQVNPALSGMPLLFADVAEPASLRAVAEGAGLVITTVGPYLLYGEPLVAACAAAGTDYVDLTGEAEFVDRMYLRHHDRAVASGARIVHACGFDSIPHDLGVLFTVEQLPDDQPIVVEGFVRASGMLSGGTLATAMYAIPRQGQARAAAKERRGAEPAVGDRRVRAQAGRPHLSRDAQAWAIPMPTIDPQIVAHSARALPAYGPDFTYRHYAAVKRLPVAVGGALGLGALIGLAHIPPAREFITSRWGSGAGPDAVRRAKSWFTVRFVGTAGGSRRVVTEVSGGDPGYGETAKMLAESAMCLAFDTLPSTAGQVTTAVATGDRLIERLATAGIRFTVLDGEPSGPPGPA